MGRYTGKAVTERNGFVSQESNTIDPNSDKNPLLDNNDPTKDNGPDRTHGDDFKVVGEDLVELKKTTESDVTEEGEVLNKITEIDNNKVKMVISMFGNDTVAEVNLNQIAEL